MLLHFHGKYQVKKHQQCWFSETFALCFAICCFFLSVALTMCKELGPSGIGASLRFVPTRLLKWAVFSTMMIFHQINSDTTCFGFLVKGRERSSHKSPKHMSPPMQPTCLRESAMTLSGFQASWHMTLYSTQRISVLSLYHKTSPKPMVGRHCDIVFIFRQSANTQKHMWSPCTILSNKKNTDCYNTTFGITD